MPSNGYTPTQQRLLAILSDGLPHTRQELWTCLNDENASPNTLRNHISYLRKKLRPIGQDIVCELRQSSQLCYRHIRLLASSHE